MTFTVSMALDLILALLLVKVVYDCWRRGFLAVLLKLAGTVASYILAALLSRPVSVWIYHRFLETRVVEAIAQRLPDAINDLTPGDLAALEGLAQFKETITEALAQAMESLDLTFFSGVDSAGAAQSVVEKVESGTTAAQAIAEAAVQPAVITLLSIGVFFVLFSLVMILVRALVRMGRGVNHVPLVGGVNRLAGLGLGVIYAGVLGYLIALGLTLVAGISGGKIPFLTTAVLEDTTLIRWLIHLKLG